MSLSSSNHCSFLEQPIKIITTLIFTLFTLSSFSVLAQSVDSCDDFVDGPSTNWTHILVATTVSDGAASQEAQTFTMNVTSLPADGANVQIVSL
jgi:hypothetical protein